MYQKKENFSSQDFVECSNCGHETNEPGEANCFFCKESLSGTTNLNKGNLRILGKNSVGKTKKPQKGIKSKYSLLLLGAVITIGSISISKTLKVSSPEAALRKSKEVIYFGGEPCSKALVTQEVTKAFQKINKNLKFVYYKDKSEDQIDNLIDGEIDIAFSERAYLAQHYERAKKRGVEIQGIAYGIDGVVFYTNKKNKIRPMTDAEIEGIIEGRITDWRQISDNGTILSIEQLQKGEEKTIIPVLTGGYKSNPMGFYPTTLNPNTKYVRDRDEAREFVENNAYAFSFTSATLAVDELEKFNFVSIRKKDGKIVSAWLSKGVTNQEAIKTGDYLLRRQVMMIVNKDIFRDNPSAINRKHNEAVRNFVYFLLTEKGQSIVEEADFVPKKKTLDGI